MKTYEEYYAELTQQLQVENLQSLSDPKTIEKVIAWAERTGTPATYAVYRFHTDAAFRLIFQKDTKKQNVAEKALYVFLTERLPSWQVEALPNKGLGSLQLVGGLVLPSTDRIIANAKTIDLRLVSPLGHIVYATHKRTSGSGGAQKNQCSDAEAFLKEAERNAEPNTSFYALLDGDYYTETIMARVNSLTRPNKTYACTSDDFVSQAIM